MHPLRIILCVIGGIILLLSLPVLGLGGLGMIGAVADMSVEENRKIGIPLLAFGTSGFLAGLFLLLGAIIVGRKNND